MKNSNFMHRAIKLAKKGMGNTSPNPMVGAVVVKVGKIIGEGFHERVSAPHAEINALSQAGEKAKGATLYVNLEPCCHYGRTPPCSKAIIGAEIKEVVIAMPDPNPLVNGKGIVELEAAGIKVEMGTLQWEAERLNESYIKYITTNLPFVVIKAAMSLDGKIATYSGDSKWITGDKAREFAHKLRAQYDAILVGIGTVLVDNPRLNVRIKGKTDARKPLKVIVDSNLRIPLEANVLKSNPAGDVIIATTPKAARSKIKKLETMGVKVIVTKPEDEKVNLSQLMEELAKLGVTSVLIEGGGTINASAIELGMVDKMFIFIAPKIIGGEAAKTAVEGRGIDNIAEAVNLKNLKIRRLGQDILIEGYIDKRGV